MRDFNRNRKFDRNDSDRGGFDRRRFGRPTMYKATCAKCGKECEVPFRPTGSKPVFCSECFEGKEGGGRFERRDFQKPRYNDNRMFKAVCDKCGNECEVPFRPTAGKPVFCDQCFEKSKGNEGKVNQRSDQLEEINSKLDEILALLTVKVSVSSDQFNKVTDSKKVVEPKKAVKKDAVKPETTAKKKVTAKKPAVKKKK